MKFTQFAIAGLMGVAVIYSNVAGVDAVSNQPSPSPKPTRKPTSPTPKPTQKTISPVTQPPTIKNPTNKPTKPPTKRPTGSPTKRPTRSPTSTPSVRPNEAPSENPSKTPTTPPSTVSPTSSPSARPSEAPSENPSKTPTALPSTVSPTSSPSVRPSEAPSQNPSEAPSRNPSEAPSERKIVVTETFVTIASTQRTSIPQSTLENRTVEEEYNLDCYRRLNLLEKDLDIVQKHRRLCASRKLDEKSSLRGNRNRNLKENIDLVVTSLQGTLKNTISVALDVTQILEDVPVRTCPENHALLTGRLVYDGRFGSVLVSSSCGLGSLDEYDYVREGDAIDFRCEDTSELVTFNMRIHPSNAYWYNDTSLLEISSATFDRACPGPWTIGEEILPGLKLEEVMTLEELSPQSCPTDYGLFSWELRYNITEQRFGVICKNDVCERVYFGPDDIHKFDEENVTVTINYESSESIEQYDESSESIEHKFSTNNFGRCPLPYTVTGTGITVENVIYGWNPADRITLHDNSSFESNCTILEGSYAGEDINVNISKCESTLCNGWDENGDPNCVHLSGVEESSNGSMIGGVTGGSGRYAGVIGHALMKPSGVAFSDDLYRYADEPARIKTFIESNKSQTYTVTLKYIPQLYI